MANSYNNQYISGLMPLANLSVKASSKAGVPVLNSFAKFDNRNPIRMAGVNPLTVGIMKLASNIVKNNKSSNKPTKEQSEQLNKEFGTTSNKTNARYTSNNVSRYSNGNNIKNNSTQKAQPNSDNSNTQANTNTLSGGDVYDILNNWKEQQEYMKPYREGLSKYIQNYPELYRNAYARDMYLSGLGDLEGSSHIASMAGKYNPMTEQAKLLDLQKAMAGELQGADKDYQSLVGNLITAQRMGLNPNQVFANDKLLQLMNSKEIANAKLAQELQLAQARMALQRQLANKRISASYGNTALRNNASMDRAIFNNIFTENPKAGLDWVRSKGYNISSDILDSLADNLFDEE